MSDNTFDKLPEYLGLFLPKPEQRITSDGVYTRVWTDERIAAMQPPEPTVIRDMKITMHDVKAGMIREMQWPKPVFNISFTPAGYWMDGIIYGLSESDRQDIGRKLLDFAARYTFPDTSRQSRRKARRRNRAKRKTNK